jgi:hypothetical protein
VRGFPWHPSGSVPCRKTVVGRGRGGIRRRCPAVITRFGAVVSFTGRLHGGGRLRFRGAGQGQAARPVRADPGIPAGGHLGFGKRGGAIPLGGRRCLRAGSRTLPPQGYGGRACGIAGGAGRSSFQDGIPRGNYVDTRPPGGLAGCGRPGSSWRDGCPGSRSLAIPLRGRLAGGHSPGVTPVTYLGRHPSGASFSGRLAAGGSACLPSPPLPALLADSSVDALPALSSGAVYGARAFPALLALNGIER